MSNCFITVSFQGFCGWSLVVYDRLLVPSNPANGVLRYKDNYYAFSDKQAAYEFANAPDRCEIKSLYYLYSCRMVVCLNKTCPFDSAGLFCKKRALDDLTNHREDTLSSLPIRYNMAKFGILLTLFSRAF